MKAISKKHKQKFINVIGAIGYFGLVFGLMIVVISVLDWFNLVELSDVDRQLVVNGGRPGDAIVSMIPTSVTYLVGVGVIFFVLLFVATMPYWVGKFGSKGLKWIIDTLSIEKSIAKLYQSKIVLLAIGNIVLTVKIIVVESLQPSVGIPFLEYSCSRITQEILESDKYCGSIGANEGVRMLAILGLILLVSSFMFFTAQHFMAKRTNLKYESIW